MKFRIAVVTTVAEERETFKLGYLRMRLMVGDFEFNLAVDMVVDGSGNGIN